MRLPFILVAALAASCFLNAQSLSKTAVKEATGLVGATIDDWHMAAAQADEARYFGRMSADAVFIGISEEQRWTRDAFRAWAHPQFEARQGWLFKSIQRTIHFSPSGDISWFDELLDVPGLGIARGTGVLIQQDGKWMISQYSLSLPVPKAALLEVTEVIRVQRFADSVNSGKGSKEGAPAPSAPPPEPSGK